jgi:hypothetical protein
MILADCEVGCHSARFGLVVNVLAIRMPKETMVYFQLVTKCDAGVGRDVCLGEGE